MPDELRGFSNMMISSYYNQKGPLLCATGLLNMAPAVGIEPTAN